MRGLILQSGTIPALRGPGITEEPRPTFDILTVDTAMFQIGRTRSVIGDIEQLPGSLEIGWAAIKLPNRVRCIGHYPHCHLCPRHAGMAISPKSKDED
ncbi:hypothetical protein RA27_17300 [Ruegeria sp. ANG-R]|nr:hypothetical protein RA27_17300 [Ruegeria sp. ANG-R]